MINIQLNRPEDVPAELPELIELRCRADEKYCANLLVMTKVAFMRRNSVNFVIGPSDSEGKIVVSRKKISEEISRSIRAFPFDYAGKDNFAGVLAFSPMVTDDINAALDAYKLYQAFIDYPPGYRETLEKAFSYLVKLKGQRLSVEVLSEHPGVRYVVESKVNV